MSDRKYAASYAHFAPQNTKKIKEIFNSNVNKAWLQKVWLVGRSVTSTGG